MNPHYPRIRIHDRNGRLVLREGLNFTFYVRRFHSELLPGLLSSLELYRSVVGPDGLGTYWDMEGDPQDLNAASWPRVMKDLVEANTFITNLANGGAGEFRYSFAYYAKTADLPLIAFEPGWLSAISYRLPTEYLEEQGPARVRELALALAAPLPFYLGYAGLSFNVETGEVQMPAIRKWCFRYPGLDILDVEWLSWHLFGKVRGVSWMNFLGEPLLGELGGEAGLRSRLHSSGTWVEALDAERVVVTLGEWPEAGDTEGGDTLPAYREFARVLEPWLYHVPYMNHSFTPAEMHHWERRFLD